MEKETPLETYTLHAHVNLRFGAQAANYLFEFIKERGWKNLGVVFDTGLLQNDYFVEFRKRLHDQCSVMHELENKESGPSYDYLDRSTDEFRNIGVDCIIAIGGGSTLDLGKAISVLLTNPGPGITYRGVNKIKVTGVPLIMIPTTAGTGSEVIPNAPMTDTKENRKQGISTSFYHAELVILDPLLTVSCPPMVTVSAAMDALLHHAVDAFTSNERNPFARFFSREAVRLIFRALPKVMKDPGDTAMRGDLQLAAMYAGFALANGGGGSFAGAASYPLEVSFHIPHGMGVAICGLPGVRFNIEKGYYGYGEYADLVPGARVIQEMDMKERALLFYEYLKELYAELAIPTLSRYGVGKEHLSALAEETAVMPVAQKNPVPMTAEDIRSILASRL